MKNLSVFEPQIEIHYAYKNVYLFEILGPISHVEFDNCA